MVGTLMWEVGRRVIVGMGGKTLKEASSVEKK